LKYLVILERFTRPTYPKLGRSKSKIKHNTYLKINQAFLANVYGQVQIGKAFCISSAIV